MDKDEFMENMATMPLLLIIWIPMTLIGGCYLVGDVFWFFGNTIFITDWYAQNFSNPIDANIWIIKEMSAFGCFLLVILIICWFRLTFLIYKTLTFFTVN